MKRFVPIFTAIILGALSFGLPPASGQFFFMENEIVGKPAQDFTLKTLEGLDVNFTKFRDGKKAIVFFWATWCPHCRTALKKINANSDEIMKKDIKLVLVDLGEKPGAVRKHVEKQRIDLTIFLDEKSSLAEPYGLVGVPTFFFINQDGIVNEVLHSLPENYEEILSK